MTDKDKKEKAIELIKEMKTGSFITKSVTGQFSARPMSHVDVDMIENKITFFSDDDTLKVFEVINDSQVLLTYNNSDKDVYVNVTGQAKITKDLNEYLKYWDDEMETWYPQGIKDPKICLIEVKISEIEYWDSDLNSLTKAYKFFVANMKNERPTIGTHGKININ